MKANRWMGFTILVLSVLLMTGCGAGKATATPLPATAMPMDTPTSSPTSAPVHGMANPAAAYCEVQGYTYEIRTAEDGGQYGVCIGLEGRECEEWALYRGECRLAGEKADKPSTTLECPTGWMVYVNTAYGFGFCYPPDWTLSESGGGDDVAGRQAPRSIALNRGTLWLRIQYKRPTEAAMLGPGGRGAGEIGEQGTVVVLGQAIPQKALTYEGKVKSVFSSVSLPDLELYIQLDDEPGPGVDYAAIDLSDEAQAEMTSILETFARISSS